MRIDYKRIPAAGQALRGAGLGQKNGHTILRNGVTGFLWDSLALRMPGGENYISLMAACAAARRAMGTRKGLQDT